MKALFKKAYSFTSENPLLLIGVIIYGYYLSVTVNYYDRATHGPVSFVDLLFQFDSLIWMWIASYIYMKLRGSERKRQEAEREGMVVRYETEKAEASYKAVQEFAKRLDGKFSPLLASIERSTVVLKTSLAHIPDTMNAIRDIETAAGELRTTAERTALEETRQLLEGLQVSLQKGNTAPAP